MPAKFAARGPQTAMDIINERAPGSTEHQSANQALVILNPETMLQLGMVADACEIVVRFIRFVDNETFAIAELPNQIEALKTAATELFHRSGCIEMEGFTKKMIALIQRPRLVTLSGGRPKTIGDANSPGPGTVERCLGRMTNWWTLASEVLQTEFPDWDFLLQFQAFRVPRDLALTSQTRGQLEHLAATFGVDPDRAMSEYEDLCPVATQFANQISVTVAGTAADVSALAWKRTMVTRMKAPKTSSLLQLLFRFVAYIGSSSGVEQTFSHCVAQFRHLRNFDMDGVQRVLVLAATRNQTHEEDLALYSRARQIWAENFGAPRRRKRETAWSGKTLRRIAEQKVCGRTEAAARRRRALALAQLTAKEKRAAVSTRDRTSTLDLRFWGPEQQKELGRQKGMQKERKLDAADMGVVAIDPRELARYRAKQKKTTRCISKASGDHQEGQPQQGNPQAWDADLD
jgi:hypothetical protein